MSRDNRESLMIWLGIFAAGFIIYSFYTLYQMLGPSPSPNLDLDLTNSQSIELYGTPGRTVKFRAYAGESIKGYWAAPDGLVLKFEPTGSDSPIDIGGVEAKPEEWGGSITVKPGEVKARKFNVEGAFLLPSSTKIGDTLQAVLSGELIYPKPANPFFADALRNLNIPVEIHVVSFSDLRGETIRRSWPNFLIPFGVGILFAVVTFLLFRSR